jgi:hypothetical protein
MAGNLVTSLAAGRRARTAVLRLALADRPQPRVHATSERAGLDVVLWCLAGRLG